MPEMSKILHAETNIFYDALGLPCLALALHMDVLKLKLEQN